MAEMVRVNTRISSTLNDWLDEQTEETGMPKSTIVMLALEQYRASREAMVRMTDINGLMEKMEQFQKMLPSEDQRNGKA